MKKQLPIGIDSFRVLREDDHYYIDKSMMIHEFANQKNTVALVTRPRRFGKTLNMTMLRDFFDVTTDSRGIFNGLAIMGTEHADLINSLPVIYFTLKDCKADSEDMLMYSIANIICNEFDKYYQILKGNVDETLLHYSRFFMLHERMKRNEADKVGLMNSIGLLARVLYEYYGNKAIILIDEYDTPIMSSYEHGYHEQTKTFFSNFYGLALKGNDYLHQAMLTGIQRVVKESIFSQLNNVKVYTVIDERYSDFFGLNENETSSLLKYYNLTLNDEVRHMYNGYMFCSTEMYNPWSMINYADTGQLHSFWINTSTNFLVRKLINEAETDFRHAFDKLIEGGEVTTNIDLSRSFMELARNSTLWGLLVNAGYITVLKRINEFNMQVRIPNDEVRYEFLRILADMASIEDFDLFNMFSCLMEKDLIGFMDIYQKIVISCTSHFDAKENAYHMLFLGMCISLNRLYKIKSNIEAGFGRSDIVMHSLSKKHPNIVIEFKQGKDIDKLREAALFQILENKYYEGLEGEVLCIGLAHDKKNCKVSYKLLSGQGETNDI